MRNSTSSRFAACLPRDFAKPASRGKGLGPGCGIRLCPLVAILHLQVALADELVTHAMDGKEILRLFGAGLELLPQVHDVRIHRARGRETLVAPHFVEQAFTAQRLAAVAEEV